MRYFYLTSLLFVTLSWYQAAAAMQKRGVATMMSFGDQAEGATSLNKRNRGTWYSGKDLKDAACYNRKGLPSFSARVSDMIGAMAMDHFEYCYECMRITNLKNNEEIEVKIVDKCAACEVGKAIDLTPHAFKKLNPEGLDDGVLDIAWKVIPCSGKIRLHFD